jgi:hypothetical protein
MLRDLISYPCMACCQSVKSREGTAHSSVITANPHVLPFPTWKFLSILLHRILALKCIRTRYSEDVRRGVGIVKSQKDAF